MAHPLRHALTWVAITVAIMAGWPAGGPARHRWTVLAIAVAAVLFMMLPPAVLPNVLAVAVVLAVLASLHLGLDRRLLFLAAMAAMVLGVFRFACLTIPTVWLVADGFGSALGRSVAAITDKPLSVGATAAGLDYLVLMAAIYVGWLYATAPPRFPRAIYAAAAILVGHFAYLWLLASATDLAAALPVPQRPPAPEIYEPPPWYWSDALRTLLPWNLPVVAAAIHLVIARLMFRWAAWSPANDEEFVPAKARPGQVSAKWTIAEWGPIALAAVLPLITVYGPASGDLSRRTILALDQGDLNWQKPVHDRYGPDSAGLYGMLPTLVECLGGRFVRSADLTEEELAQADVLLVIHPARPLPEDKLQRIWDYVEEGGSLLLLAEPRVQNEKLQSQFDEFLAPTAMRVRFDTAIPAAAAWEHSLDLLAHPAVAGLDDQRNRLGLALASSIRVSWPARPLVVARWGWSDPGGSDLDVHRYDAGERLGDLVLAAEQRMGRGTVGVLANAIGMTNEMLPSSYEFAGRWLGCLATRPGSPQAGWRQALGLLACLLLVGLLARRSEPVRLALAAAVLGMATVGFAELSLARSTVLPDGRQDTPNTVACIDGSHLESYSRETRNETGIAGLQLALMRNGCLPLVLNSWNEEQLKRSGLFISIAPSRSYSPDERKTIRRFLEAGGVMIAMAGADQAEPLRPLLADFGLGLPVEQVAPGKMGSEPVPFGHERGTYRDTGEYRVQAMFHAGWPVDCAPGAALVNGPGNRLAAAWVGVGQGKFVLIGDTGFAWNKNLENADGELAEGGRENRHFWRWLLTRVTDQPEWVPPKPEPVAEPAGEEEGR